MEAFGRFERAGWAGVAGGYDRVLGLITDRVAEHLLDAAGVAAGMRVLDVACGPGYAAVRAVSRGGWAVGVDLSPAMVMLAREGHPKLGVLVGEAGALPFADGTFDAVVGNLLLHHLATPQAAMLEWRRVLRPGGRLALAVWDRPERARFVGVLLEAMAEAEPLAPADLPPGPPFFRYADTPAMTELYDSAEFADVSHTNVVFVQRLAGPDDLWDGLLEGTVRTGALVRAQPPEIRARIRAAFDRRVAPHVRGGELFIPVAVKLATGVRRAA